MKEQQSCRLCRRFRSRLFGGLLAAALFSWCPGAAASVPDWLRALTRVPLPEYPEDTDAVMLLSEQVTTVKGSGEIVTVYRRAFKIVRPEGREHGHFAVHFDMETRLTFLKAWSISAGGVEYEVKEKDAVETSGFGESLYEDTRYKVLEIPGAEPGNIIGYEYEQKRRPYVLQDTWDFQKDLPVRRARFVLQLPSGWEFQGVWLHHAEQAPQRAGENQWVWELENIPALDQEPAMPPRRAVAGRFGVTYYSRDERAREKSHASWRDVGLWYAGLASGSRQTTPEIRKKVADLTAGVPASLDRLHAIAAFVQAEIRYVAIEIGIGGYQPHPAQDIFVKRYGDCKDKATLLGTMLHEIGIESYYVLTHSSRGVVAVDFPSMLNFNHVILAIRLPDDVPATSLYATQTHAVLGRLLFFDPTDSHFRLGYLPPTLQANNGLLVTPGGGELLQLPLLPPSTNRLLRAGKLRLDDSGTLSGEVREVRWGAPAAARRQELLDAQGTERVSVLENLLGGFFVSFMLTGSQAENLEDYEKSLVLDYRFVAENYARGAGSLLLVRPRVLGQKSSDLLEKKERKYPVEFASTTLETDQFEITLPKGYGVDELPTPLEIDCGFAVYKSKTEVAGNVIQYYRVYQVKDVNVPINRLEELKRFYRQISLDERSSVVLKRIDQ